MARHLVVAGLLAGLLVGALATAADDPGMNMSQMDMSRMDMSQGVRRSEDPYKIPDVSVVRADGRRVRLRSELDDGRPVVMNFIYTRCTTICPMSSQLFERFQQALGPRSHAVHLVSISIDPEEDTPARLRTYARKFHAQAGWDHYTGNAEAIIAVERAFLVYHGDKMGHTPLTLMRAGPGRPWVRYDGLATPQQLLAEMRGWRSEPHLAKVGR